MGGKGGRVSTLSAHFFVHFVHCCALGRIQVTVRKVRRSRAAHTHTCTHIHTYGKKFDFFFLLSLFFLFFFFLPYIPAIFISFSNVPRTWVTRISHRLFLFLWFYFFFCSSLKMCVDLEKRSVYHRRQLQLWDDCDHRRQIACLIGNVLSLRS